MAPSALNPERRSYKCPNSMGRRFAPPVEAKYAGSSTGATPDSAATNERKNNDASRGQSKAKQSRAPEWTTQKFPPCHWRDRNGKPPDRCYLIPSEEANRWQRRWLPPDPDL